ncbi:hypothetical protein DSO57_1008369 [Entomophthora muscae]|uniref:Uncharacterized protein n=1 Tax=Entomophthora muscae TaxID=34485 RepID=A0ACC2RY76_9FUNG|nr:hypothetical protein DSO57_1008369 [Entomophthora muscae]
MVAYFCWERILILQFRGPVVMWSTLMLAMENPYVISTKRLEVRNNIFWQISRMKLIRYAQLYLQDFSFNGLFLTDDQISCALKLLELVFAAWSDPRCAGSRQSMALIGNLVLSSSKVVYHQRLHHMLKYIEWLLGVIYLVGGKTPKEYSQQESLLWECIFLGLAFPYSIGMNCVNFLPVDDSPFLPLAFCWLPNVLIIYAAIAKVFIQLRLGLEAIVSQ